MNSELLRMVLANYGDIEEWKLGDPERAKALGYPRRYDAPTVDDFATLFCDLTLDGENGQPVCHEVNGSNAVGSDALTGDSTARAGAEAEQAVRRARELRLVEADGRLRAGVVTLHAHQHWRWFRTGGEFYPRVAAFAEALQSRSAGTPVVLRSPHDLPAANAVSVVVGDVPAVARALELDPASGQFQYHGRPVIFIGNPNLLTELVRVGRLPDLSPSPAMRVLHGAKLLPAIQDKCLQQDFFRGTRVRPLRYFTASSIQQAEARITAMLKTAPVVVKPNGTSGGTGVHVLVPGSTGAAIRAKLEALVSDCVAKYGENSDATIFPLRGFEFVRSTAYGMEDGDHLWDLRIGLHMEPGVIEAYPVSMRLTPAPFGPETFQDNRDEWISNVSGRTSTLLLSGMDSTALAAVGLDDDRLRDMMDSCVTWALKAWDACSRGEGVQPTYEDQCEVHNPDFYPRAQFNPTSTP